MYNYVHVYNLNIWNLTSSFFENHWTTNSSSGALRIPARSDDLKFIGSTFGKTESLEAILQNLEKRAVRYPLVSIKIFIFNWYNLKISKIEINYHFQASKLLSNFLTFLDSNQCIRPFWVQQHLSFWLQIQKLSNLGSSNIAWRRATLPLNEDTFSK